MHCYAIFFPTLIIRSDLKRSSNNISFFHLSSNVSAASRQESDRPCRTRLVNVNVYLNSEIICT